MSINTANLITTQNGQAELAEVHRVNAELFKDHREISVELLFPYIAISDKTPEVIEGTSAVTEAMVKQEPCWANVDICQTQTYATLGVLKRDFAIGGLFEVRQDIENARTVILYARTRIVDSRSAGKKVRDGNRSAEDIVSSNYSYETKMLPYAYTRVLDSNGEYLETGITIGASRYGRSRHRFYFNYIIDNNDGIADNITVDDVVYPYSDGYLSKTAFELGLERYEKAIKEYMAEYEKYANGRNLCYLNRADAMEHAVHGHKFFLEEDELDYYFLNIDLKAASSNYDWLVWAETQLTRTTFPETYGGITAKNFDPNVRNVLDGTPVSSAVHERGEMFSKTIMKSVEFTNLDGETSTKYMAMRLNCLMMVRTGFPYMADLSFNSAYNFARVSVQFYDFENDVVIDGGFQMASATWFNRTNDDDLLFIPQMPSVGKVKIRERSEGVYTVEFLLMTHDLKTSIYYYDSDYGDGNGCHITPQITIRRIKFMSDHGQYDVVTHTSPITNRQISMFRRYEVPDMAFVFPTNSGAAADLEHCSGGLSYLIQDNFAGGYSFSVLQQTDYNYRIILPKEFEDADIESSESVAHYNDALVKGTYIINDTATIIHSETKVIVGKDKLVYSDFNSNYFGFKYNIWDEIGDTSYRIISDCRLHNARVLIGEECPNDYRNVTSSTKIIIVAYVGNNVYSFRGNYSDILGTSAQYQDVVRLEAIEAAFTNIRENTSLNADSTTLETNAPVLVLLVRKGDGTSFTQTIVKSGGDFEISTKRNVAITDISGGINLIPETVCK